MTEQRFFSGRGELSQIPDHVNLRQYHRVLIIHGKHSYQGSGAAEILSRIDGATVAHFDDVKTNPDIETVRVAAERYREFEPDCVIAVGGGSVLDTAKAMIAAAVQPDDDAFFSSRFELPADRPDLVAVPTTAGSGSEATHFAVVYAGKNKHSIAHPRLRPDLVVLDPNLTISCSQELTLASGADALCQGIESWWSNGHTEESRLFSMAAVPAVLHTLFDVVRHPESGEARENMLVAANNAGKAINISKTTAGHALSYGLTSTFGLPHGLAVLSVMQFLVEDMDKNSELPPGIEALGGDITGEQPLPSWFDAFCEHVWRINPIGDYLGVLSDATVESLAQHLGSAVNLERLSNHPARLSISRIHGVYRKIFTRHRKVGS